jgi:hypothetical protein
LNHDIWAPATPNAASSNFAGAAAPDATATALTGAAGDVSAWTPPQAAIMTTVHNW